MKSLKERCLKTTKSTYQMRTLLAISSLVIFASCSSTQFTNHIQNDRNDLLTEESLMRYNTNRLSKIEDQKSFISNALVACHQDKITKGLAILEEEMHKNKTNPLYWNALGTCFSLNKEYSKSVFYYELGLEATRDSNKNIAEGQRKLAEAAIQNNLGLIHLKHKRFDEAFDSFKKSSSLMPNFFTPEFNIAQLFIEFNENKKALEILKKLEMKNNDDIDLLYSLALVHYRMNDLNKSFNYVTKINKDYLNRADIVGLYAYNLMKKNRLEEAKSILEKRLYANEYNKRNELILDEVNLKIKESNQAPTEPVKKK